MARPIATLPLPGDTDGVLQYELGRAIRRDNRLNIHEWRAKGTGEVCAYSRAQFRYWECNSALGPCYWCIELR